MQLAAAIQHLLHRIITATSSRRGTIPRFLLLPAQHGYPNTGVFASIE